MKARPRAARLPHGFIDVQAAAGDMLNALALILMQIFLDLAFVVGGFVDRYADLAARARQGPREKAGLFSFDVEIADLPEIEEILVEAIPAVHIAAEDIIGQMIKVVYAAADRPRIFLADPIKGVRIGRTFIAIAVDEIDEAAAYAFDRRDVERLWPTFAGIRLGALRHGMGESPRGVDDAPSHSGRGRAVEIDETAAETLCIRVQNIVHVALPIEIDPASSCAGRRARNPFGRTASRALQVADGRIPQIRTHRFQLDYRR